jgi:hypothetical protein
MVLIIVLPLSAALIVAMILLIPFCRRKEKERKRARFLEKYGRPMPENMYEKSSTPLGELGVK